jgi:hypothetical protein
LKVRRFRSRGQLTAAVSDNAPSFAKKGTRRAMLQKRKRRRQKSDGGVLNRSVAG